MSLITITKPLVEPVSLADAKQHCRTDGAEEDTLLEGMIRAARAIFSPTARPSIPINGPPH